MRSFWVHSEVTVMTCRSFEITLFDVIKLLINMKVNILLVPLNIIILTTIN